MAMKVYYHYTDKDGYSGIHASGVIQESTKLDAEDDARFGNGVYFTDLPPSAGKPTIANLCWGTGPNAGPAMVKRGRVDYVFEIRFPAGAIQKATKPGVFLYKGDFKLSHKAYEV